VTEFDKLESLFGLSKRCLYLSASAYIATPSASPPLPTGLSTTEFAAADAILSSKRACKAGSSTILEFHVRKLL